MTNVMIDSDLDDSSPSNIDEEAPFFPGYTKWHRSKYCCTNNAIKIDNLNITYLGHWEADIGFPIAVTLIIVTSYLVGMIIIFPCWPKSGKFMATILSILFFLFIYSYFRIIIDGPGYLPFYWPLKHDPNSETPKSNTFQNISDNFEKSSFLDSQKSDKTVDQIISEELSPSGIISTNAQIKWTEDRQKPPRSILSRDGRRYVIRPDHVCGWTASWIGKRNYKFFLLFNIYGFLYISTFLGCCILEIICQMNSEQPSPIIAVIFVYTFLALTFMILTGTFMCSHSYQMCINQTSWEDWNKLDYSRYDRGCIENVTDVCGPWSGWYTFLLPISPWTKYTNNELIKGYSPYGQIRE
ncbi:DHHC zinc finger domain containing protein [Tritrichomonas foetus]|uniref:Palmitoyltransferase n=1 Tax=Tritrichomonas foetus TaxID=1144522 RepID=A0A1J4JY29_9EUKA|nr:DHHC zinc finger domain containing protein [Tritrichomonas foetus]|eukprot:OHT03360.1 DHHC zinc finger domain containing protein [Tritrichomonas foetus]